MINYTNFRKLIKNTRLEYLDWISVHPPWVILGGSTFYSNYSCESVGIGFFFLPILHTLIGWYLPIVLYKTVQPQISCVGSVNGQQSSCHATNFWLDLGRGSDWTIKNIPLVVPEPLQCSFGSLSCWKVNFHPNFSFLAEGSRFSSRIFSVFCSIHFPFHPDKCRSPYWWETSSSQWCCHYLASQYGSCSLGDVLCWVDAKCIVLHFGQNFPSWFRQTSKLFATWLQNLRSVFCIPQMGLKVGFFE